VKGRRRPWISKRVAVAAVLLASLALVGLFAELIAADAPFLVVGRDRIALLPAVATPDRYEGRSVADIEALHADDFTLWPLIRGGPEHRVEPNLSACAAHPMGTDARGRDIVARLTYGARTALGFAGAVMLLSLLLGTLFGTLAGYAGGFFDEMLSRPVELVESFPTIVVVAVVRAIDPDGSLWSLLLAVAAVRWAEVARLVRSEVMRVSGSEFVVAARALGCSRWQLLMRHILPNAMGPVVVSAFFAVSSLVLLETAVAFVGFGTDGSWGVLIADGLRPGAPLRGTFYGVAALGTTVLAAYWVAAAAGDSLDARVVTRGAVRL